MNLQTSISTAWEKIQAMINGLIVMLPNIVLAFIVFALFYLAARGIRTLVKRVTRRHRANASYF
jgi:uncharacterized membrane protein